VDSEAVPSLRLVQVLRTYYRRDDPTAVQDLRASLADGRYPWFREDLTAALTVADPSSPWWADTIGPAGYGDPRGQSAPAIRAQLHRVWCNVFPAEQPPEE
jgi:hypothetical protein